MVAATPITDIQTALTAYSAGFEPGLLSGADALAVLEAAATIENAAATVKALAARRVAETQAWAGEGDRSPAQFLARRTGMNLTAARDALTTAGRLHEQPEVDAAARTGRLSAPQATSISDAAAANPGAEGRLVAGAPNQPLSRLRDQCGQAKRAADPDPEATYRRIHASRRLGEHNDTEGAWNLCVRNTPDIGARFRAALDRFSGPVFDHARQQGRREPHQAYAADAFSALIDHVLGQQPAATTQPEPDPGTGGEADRAEPAGPAAGATPAVKPGRLPKYLGLVRVDHTALVRGKVGEDEICEIAGIGPVPVSVARDLLGDAVLHLVITRGVDVANTTYLGRGPNAAQKLALAWNRDRCTVDTCTRRRGLQADHRVDYAHTRHTRLDELDPLCEHHHRLKTHHNWALVEGTGPRAFVPPDHPHHPNNQPDNHTTDRSPPHAAR